MNIEQKFLDSANRPTGFDYMRLILACSVIGMHSVRTSYGIDIDSALWDTPLRPYLKLILPMFFALSGFLVSGSLERTRTLGIFLGLRFLRIYPALIVEVLLSAYFLGAIYTTLPLADYFKDPGFFQYLTNVTGIIHYFLPGVFKYNPDAGNVNLQLWTVPYELKCYILLGFLALIGIKKWRALAPLASFALIFFMMITGYIETGSPWGNIGNTNVPGLVLLSCFLFGVSIYLYRDRLPYSQPIFIFCLLSSVGLYFIRGLGDEITPPMVAYITVYLGLLSPRKIHLLQGADYSYGMFLYGYPIQQAFSALGNWTHHWYLNIAVCLPLAALFAALSWHLIEKPVLALKPGLMNLEKAYLSWKTKRSGQIS